MLSFSLQNKLSMKDILPSSADSFFCIRATPSGDMVLGGENQVVTASVSSTEKIAKLFDTRAGIFDIKLNGNGSILFAVGDDKDPIVYSFKNKTKQSVDRPDANSLVSCSCNYSGSLFTVTSTTGQLCLYSMNVSTVEDIELVNMWKVTDKDIKLPRNYHVYNSEFMNDGLILCSGKNCLQTIEMKGDDWKYDVISSISHAQPIYLVKKLKENIILTVGLDKLLKVWNLYNHVCLFSIAVDQLIQRVEYHEESNTVVFLDIEGNLHAQPNFVYAPSEEKKPDFSKDFFGLSKAPASESKPERQAATEAAKEKENGPDQKSKEAQANPIVALRKMDQEYPKLDLEETIEERVTRKPAVPKRKEVTYDEDDEILERFGGKKAIKEIEEEELVERGRNKPNLDQYLSTAPQEWVNNGAVPLIKNVEVLCHNFYGKVEKRHKEEFITVEYSDYSFPKKNIPCNTNFSMASLNFSGVALVFPGRVVEEELSDDFDSQCNQGIIVVSDPESKSAELHFHPSNSRDDTWHVSLPTGEAILAVTVSNRCVAIATSKALLRVFTLNGQNYSVTGTPGEVIALASFQSHICVIRHAAYPFSGHQCIKMDILDALYSTVVQQDIDLALEKRAKLRWIGYSQEGFLYAQDSHHRIFTLVKTMWIPLTVKEENHNIWIISIADRKITGYLLPRGEAFPSPYLTNNIKLFDLNVLGLNDTEEMTNFRNKRLELMQERERSSQWLHLKNAKGMEANEMDSVKTKEQLEELAMALDKIRMDMVRQNLLQKKEETALFFALEIEQKKMQDICGTMMEQLKFGKLSLRLNQEYNTALNERRRWEANPTAIEKPLVQIVYQQVEKLEQAFPETSSSSFKPIQMNKKNFSDLLAEDNFPVKPESSNHAQRAGVSQV